MIYNKNLTDKMIYSGSYRWYFNNDHYCFVAGQYVSTTPDYSGGSSTGGSSSSTCYSISGTCTCKESVGNFPFSCSSKGLMNYSDCSSYCNKNYSGGVYSSTCKTTTYSC